MALQDGICKRKSVLRGQNLQRIKYNGVTLHSIIIIIEGVLPKGGTHLTDKTNLHTDELYKHNFNIFPP